jgi:hypothetical protein
MLQEEAAPVRVVGVAVLALVARVVATIAAAVIAAGGVVAIATSGANGRKATWSKT